VLYFVGEVPDADVTGLDPDDDIRAMESLHVGGTVFRAEIPGRDAQRRLRHPRLDEARQPPDLDRAQRRVRFGHERTIEGPRTSTQRTSRTSLAHRPAVLA